MSARLLYSLLEENSYLQKQRGCSNGVLQISHDFLMGRSINGHDQKWIQSGQSNNNEPEFKLAIHKSKLQDKGWKMMEEKERNSSELSTASRSSDLSTLPYQCHSQNADREPSSFSGNSYLGHSSPDSTARQGNALHTYAMQGAPAAFIQGHGPLSKAVKDQELRPIKHIDHPRTQYQSTTVKQKISALYEPSHSRTASHNASPASMVNRNTDWLSATKDPPCLSFDERESRDSSKSCSKCELPTLSLVGQRQAITRTTSGRNFNLLPTEQWAEKNRRDTNLQPEPRSHKTTSNIVAKLMGLDALPDYTAVMQVQIKLDKYNISKNLHAFSTSSRSINERELNQAPNSPRTCQMKNADSTMKSQPDSRNFSDAAPWKQWEEHPGPEVSAPKHHENKRAPLNISVSIYGEIKKRLSQLDFKNSRTDLRALKQIVEAIQTRSKLETRQESQAHVKTIPVNNNDSNKMSSSQGSRCTDCQNLHCDCKMTITSKESRSTENIHLSTSAIKPDKVLQTSAKTMIFTIQDEALEHLPNLRRLRTHQLEGNLDQEKQTTKILSNDHHFQDPLPHSLDAMDNDSRARTVAPVKSPKFPKYTIKDEITNPKKSTQRARKPMLENQHHVPASQTDPFKTKQHNVQQVESGTSSRKINPKAPAGGNSHTKTNTGSTCPIQQGKSATQRKTIIVQQIEPAVNRQEGKQKGTMLQVDRRKNYMDTLKTATAVQEQPSPVSVFDAAFNGDETLSPVKKRSVSSTDGETRTSLEAKQQMENIHHLSDSSISSFTFESYDFNGERIQHIGQKSWQHKCIQDVKQDSIRYPLQDLNADDNSLFNILLPSCLISQVDFNLSRTLVSRTAQANMEQTRSIFPPNVTTTSRKGNTALKPTGKLERRLIFDVAHEILVDKIASMGSPPKLSPLYDKKLGGSCVSGAQLLKELSEELRSLQANSLNNRLDDDEGFGFLENIIEKDLMNVSEKWALSRGEISGLVLDVERLIFKDLVVQLLDY